MNDKLILVENLALSYWHNNVGVHSVKDLLTLRKNPFTLKPILHDVSFELDKGQSLGILGRNGSGKSTLLRAIAGIIKPQKGRVVVNGSIAPILAIGAGLELELTGFENIKLLLALYGQSKNMAEQINDICIFSELSHEVLNMAAKCYSAGMLARLAFSISLANDCDILIIDEVLAVGDKGFQEKCVQKIYELKSLGKTIIFVSHFPDEVEKLCDKALLLENGTIINQGNVNTICNQYRQLF
ncbi:MAG: ABC transporter ATP-binding protein [Phycisphaerales bacterium]|nr:ABC transporter ATP-binding protein [Phycisphaerales bacterium]